MLYAEGAEESAYSRASNAGIGFRQEFNTYLWTANVSLDQQVAKRWHLSFLENFRTSMLRIASEGDRWKDDQELGMRLSYSVLPCITLQTQFQSILFIDKQSGFDNDVKSHSGTVGAIYKPLPRLESAVKLGPKWDSRYYQNDRGLHYGLSLRGSQFDWGGYNNGFEFLAEEDRYDRRKNSTILATYRVNARFSARAADSLDLYVTNRRRDNYVSVQGDVESQREDVKGLRNALFYSLNESMDINIKSFLEFKNVELLQYGEASADRRRSRNDQRLTNDIGLLLRRKKTRGYLTISHVIQEQRYEISVNGKPFSERTAFITPDNSSSRLMTIANIESRLSPRDSIAAYFSVSKFQYDTPDTNNFDDRDELRMNVRAAFSHRFSSMLRLELLTGVNLYHMVYIFGERSADNNWNRIFLLRPTIEFKPAETFSLFQSFEVLANYVDYDFEDPTQQTRSFIFRKFAMTDSLEWNVLPRTTFTFDYRLQLEENGQLYWERWSQNLIATRTKQWFHFLWRYQLKGHIFLAPGYSIYSRDEWRYSSNPITSTQNKEKAGTYISHGPILKCHFTPRTNLRVFVEATRLKVSVMDQNDYSINNVEVGLRWIF